MRIAPSLVLAVLLAAPATGQSAQDGWSLFQRRDYKAALERFEKDVRTQNESAVLHDALGWCHYFLDDFAAAEKEFRRALELDQNYKWSREGLDLIASARKAPLAEADALFASGRYTEARAGYLRIASGELQNSAAFAAEAHAGDGWCLYYLGRYDEAIKSFQRALKARSDFAAAARGVGYCKYALREWSEALVALQLGFKNEPEHYEARLTAGWCHYWKNDFASARREFQRAADKTEGAWGAFLGLGWCSLRENDDRNAFEHFRRAVELSPDAFGGELRAVVDARPQWRTLYRTAGVSALRARNDSIAREHFETALRLDPRDVEALRGRAFTLFRLGEFEKALAAADAVGAGEAALAVASFPTTTESGARAEIPMDLDSLRGWCHYRLGSHDKAAASFEKALRAHGDWVDARCGLAWVALARGDAPAAERGFREALEILPGYSDAVSGSNSVRAWRFADYDAAWTLYGAGRFEDAANAFRAIAASNSERFPRDRVALLDASIGWCAARRGDRTAALHGFEAALRAEPELGLAHKGLGFLAEEAKQWPAAMERLDRASKCADLVNDSETWSMLGWAAHFAAAFERSAAAFEKATALDPYHASALGGLGASQAARKQFVEARLTLERALSLDPSLEDAHWFRDAVAASPEFHKLHSPTGWAWYGRGEMKRAEQSFRRAFELDPLEPSAKTGLALALIGQGRLDEGRDAMGKVLVTLVKKESHWGGAAQTLSDFGWALYGAGAWSDAVKVFRQLTELHATSRQRFADPLAGLGWSYLQMGKKRESREAFLEAIAITPRHESSLAGLEKLAESP